MIVRIILVLGLLIALPLTYIGYVSYNFLNTPLHAESEEIIFEVLPGSFTANANRLQREGLISNAKYFVWYARLTKKDSGLRVGEYKLNKNYSPMQILNELIYGQEVKYAITIPEGYNILEIQEVLLRSNLENAEGFLDLVRDANFVKELTGMDLPSLEGFLFPDTYYFSRKETLRKIITTMYNRFERVYDQILSGNNLKNMDKLSHIVFASMIEKETGAPEEREIISSVFHNRLKKRMRLQSDPTILYGMFVEDGTWVNRIRRVDIRRATAYNTYTIPALPPAPIANPGEHSLRASLNPIETDYLFFVSRNDGTHVFSKTYAEHRAAVAKYQLDPRMREGRSWRDLQRRRQAD